MSKLFAYAQLSQENIVISISELSGEVEEPNLILLTEYDVSLLGATYDSETGEFTPAPPIEPAPPLPDPNAERMTQLEQDNAVLLMQVAELTVQNEQQAGDMALTLMKNAELETQLTQTSQEQASLFMELTTKGVI